MLEFTLWWVREKNSVFNPWEVYADGSTLFSIQVFHGGYFKNSPGRIYAHGKMNYIDMVDADEFSVMEFNAMFKMLGYSDDEVVYYHYKIPGQTLDSGLRSLGTDQDVRNMCGYITQVKVIEVYVEHWVTCFKSPNMSRSNVVIEEINDVEMNVDNPNPTNESTPTSRRLLAIGWLDDNVEFNENAYAENEVNDDGNEVNDDETAGDENADGYENEVNDDGYENEVNDDGNEVNDENDDDSDDLDFRVDKENEIEDVEVDMETFKACVEQEDNVGDGEDDDNQDDEGVQVDLDDFDSADDEQDPPLKKALKINRKKYKGLRGVHVPFRVGQFFKGKEQIKDLVVKHALESRRQLVVKKNDKVRFTVVCYGVNPQFVSGQGQVGNLFTGGTPVETNACDTSKGEPLMEGSSKTIKKERFPTPTCPWLLHCSKSTQTGSDEWIVKTFHEVHNCLQTREVRLFTVSSLARDVEQIIEGNPTIPLRALQDQLQKKHQIQLSLQKTFRAKSMAIQKIQGDYHLQYTLLRDYCEELKRSNPGTTVKLDVERECNPSSPTRQFKRIYICLGALKVGFKMSGRNLLGLDGCFIKGPYPGQVLTAVGIDANNGIYPVAYSIVEAENSDSWKWFLMNLGDDLDLGPDSNFTFITDRQKGLIPALARVFPAAEHRFCLRHIHQNMKAKWNSQLFKDLLWGCATATTIPQFNREMKSVRRVDAKLYDWLKKIPPKSWSRAHFTGIAKSDVVLNNFCEVFNSQLVGGRDKPIITCLEYIREYIMKKIVAVHKVIAKANGPLTPAAANTFSEIKDQAAAYTVIMAGGNKFQVSGPFLDRCAVDVEKRTCSCRKWDLTGMPCKHAVAAIWDMSRHGIQVGIPEAWVDEVYWLDTWKKVYMNTIEPMNGRDMWTPSECPTTITPPKHHTPIGRPKKKRQRSAFEDIELSRGGKLTRRGGTVTCGKCKQQGHNSRSCKGQSAKGKGQASKSKAAKKHGAKVQAGKKHGAKSK